MSSSQSWIPLAFYLMKINNLNLPPTLSLPIVIQAPSSKQVCNKLRGLHKPTSSPFPSALSITQIHLNNFLPLARDLFLSLIFSKCKVYKASLWFWVRNLPPTSQLVSGFSSLRTLSVKISMLWNPQNHLTKLFLNLLVSISIKTDIKYLRWFRISVSQPTIDQEEESKKKVHSTVSLHPNIYQNVLSENISSSSSLSINTDVDVPLEDKEESFKLGRLFYRRDTSLSIITVGRYKTKHHLNKL